MVTAILCNLKVTEFNEIYKNLLTARATPQYWRLKCDRIMCNERLVEPDSLLIRTVGWQVIPFENGNNHKSKLKMDLEDLGAALVYNKPNMNLFAYL